SIVHRRRRAWLAGRHTAGRASSFLVAQGAQHFGREVAESAQHVQPESSAASPAASVGVVPTRTPCASSACFFPSAVPLEPEMIAPAGPIVSRGGAEKRAM